ncbi:hypothetical protein [Rhizobium wenxiniae]|uniref:hypothetical protein n=1 Tax=Rhizobium wenxiniae TaxID=1737357 RepID=UPI003C15BCA3
MQEETEIRLCEPAPFIYFENGQIAVTDGSTVWLVIVTCEAMRATAPPPEKSLRRLVRYAEFYRDLAAAAIRRGDDVDGKVWVRESDVIAARQSNGVRGQNIHTLDRV